MLGFVNITGYIQLYILKKKIFRFARVQSTSKRSKTFKSGRTYY